MAIVFLVLVAPSIVEITVCRSTKEDMTQVAGEVSSLAMGNLPLENRKCKMQLGQ